MPHTFRYGNGSADQTSRRIELPAFVGGKELRVRLHVVPGGVPLLLSKRLLKGLGAKIDMTDNKMTYLCLAGFLAFFSMIFVLEIKK